MNSEGVNPRRVMEIHLMSQESEFAQICSGLVAVYLLTHLKIYGVQFRYKKRSVRIDSNFKNFSQLIEMYKISCAFGRSCISR